MDYFEEAPRIHKPKFGSLFSSLIVIFVLAIVMLILIGFNTLVLISLAYTHRHIPIPIYIFEIMLVGYFLMAVVPTFIGLYTIRLHASASGLKYTYWPFCTIESTWEQTSHIGKPPFSIGKRQHLYLNDAKAKGSPILLWAMKLPTKKYFIPLSSFEGWPNGALAEDIRQYAPHLFDASST